MTSDLPDGLYRVTTPNENGFCAGFVVENHRVIACAPILRKNFRYWEKTARLAQRPNEQPLES